MASSSSINADIVIGFYNGDIKIVSLMTENNTKPRVVAKFNLG